MLAKEPSARYGNAQELVLDLKSDRDSSIAEAPSQLPLDAALLTVLDAS